MSTHHYTQRHRQWAERTDAVAAAKEPEEMTVNKLNERVHGKDRDKPLIVAVGPADYVTVTGVLPNEDNVELGSEKYPVET